MKRFTNAALLVTASLAIVSPPARAQSSDIPEARVTYAQRTQIPSTPVRYAQGAQVSAPATYAQAAQVTTPITYVQGDFLLGFRATGGTGSASNILVDIGPGSLFLNSHTPVTFTLGNLGTRLASIFGASWFNRADLFSSLAGAGVSPDPLNTLYLTAPVPFGGTATPWNRLGNAVQQGVRSKINTEGTQYNSYTQTTGNPAVVEGQLDTNSYGSYHPGGTVPNSGPPPGISYAVYNPTIENTFLHGIAGFKLELFRLIPGSGLGQDIGQFTISNTGVLRFTPQPIPEPSTFASIVLGAGILLIVLRRRRSVASYRHQEIPSEFKKQVL